MKQLRGIVMCGGQSKRMGSDKGLITIQNTCWARHMANKLAVINLPVTISVNASQIESYQSIFPEEQLTVDSLAIAGPLNGLLSVHTKYPDNDLLLLACDMIDMQTETIKRLVDTYRIESGYGYYVYQSQQVAEPFCAIYTSECLGGLIQTFNLLNQPGLSFQKILNEGDTLRLPITEGDSFMNYNSPC